MQSPVAEITASYHADGYVVIPGMFTTAVTDPLLDAVGQGALSVIDRDGARQNLNVWTWCGDDLIGRFPRVDPMVDLAESLLGESVYHWHSKLSWKQPNTTGTWDWHQDYGFWREEGCARPAMTTISIALDHNTTENGCLRVIKGSHLVGDIDHIPVGKTRAADPDRVAELEAELGVVDVELEPGDVVCFHSRTLHGSSANNSQLPRTLLHCSYNAVSNAATAPMVDGHQLNELHRLAVAGIQPGGYDRVFGDTPLIRPDASGYGGRDGYVVVAADG